MGERLTLAEGNSLGGITRFLSEIPFNPQVEHVEFEIPVNLFPITSQELRDLVSLPFEVELTEEEGIVVVNTGLKGRMPIRSPEHRDRRFNSRLSLHTHPKDPDDPSLDFNTPSIGDADVTDICSRHTPQVLVYESGAMVYQSPLRNPIDGTFFHGDTRDLALVYARYCGIDLLDGMGSAMGSLINYSDLTKGQITRFCRDFVEKSGMIKQEALWGDVEGMQKILGIVNLVTV